MKKVTAMDIARACGVSQATVSYVINDKPGKSISAATREKVLEAARRLGYYPDQCARSMRRRTASSIGLMVGSNSVNLTFNNILRGIKRCADRLGYTLTLLTDDIHDGQIDDQLAQYYASNTIAGIIFMFYELTAEARAQLESRGIPYVLVGETGVSGKDYEMDAGLDQVLDQIIGYAMERGFSRIAYYSFTPRANTAAPLKYEMLSRRIEALYPRAELCSRLFDRAQPERELASALDNCDLIVTGTPRITFLAQSAILQKEFRVPQAIRLISLCHSSMFDMIYPSVTHIEIPLSGMGEYATEYLIDTIAGLPAAPAEFRCALKMGQSTL